MLKGLFAGLGALACLAAGNASAADFDSLYFFGDSLTDSGSFIVETTPPAGGRFTIDPGHVWAEDLAAYYATSATPYGLFIPDPISDSGTHLVVRLGGTNYAQGGARVAEEPGMGILNAETVSEQIDTYLSATAGADPNALYTVWAGANDVFYQAAAAGSGAITSRQAAQRVSAAALAEVNQVSRLHSAGARYILVPNLPDIGRIPATLLQGIQQTGAATGASEATIDTAVGAAVQALRAGDADQAIATSAAILGVPASAIEAARDGIKTGFTQLSLVFDRQLFDALGNAGFEVIPIDDYSLFNEVLADPGAYGLSNVIAPACNTALALQCNTSTVVDGSRNYFFSDAIHPTPTVHAILTDYVVSVIEAPQEISLLPNVATHAGRSQAQALDSHLRIARESGGAGGFNTFISGGLNDLHLGADPAVADLDAVNRNFTAGVDWQFFNGSLIGAAVGYSDSNPSFGDHGGGFDLHDRLIMLYAATGFGHAYVNAVAGVGLIDFDHIKREIHLGPATRIEQGNTEGRQQVLRVAAGYRFALGALSTGPVAAVTYQRIHADGYRESGNRSTSMHFDDQSLYSLMGSFGWQATVDLGKTALGHLHPYVRATYKQEFKNRDRSVRAGLNTLPGSFSMPAYRPDRYYTVVAFGIDDRLGENTTASLGLGTAVGLEGGDSDSVTLSLSQHF